MAARLLVQTNRFSYIKDERADQDNSLSEGQYVEEPLETIANEPYILIEEPEVEIINSHTDDILFEIMTKSRSVDNLVDLYRAKADQMKRLHNSVFLARFVKLLKTEEMNAIQAEQELDTADGKERQTVYDSVCSQLADDVHMLDHDSFLHFLNSIGQQHNLKTI